MDQAKPWYLSKSVLAQLAAIIMLVGAKFGLLPADMTNDQLVAFLIVFVPMVVGVVGRLTASHVLTATKAGAANINGG